MRSRRNFIKVSGIATLGFMGLSQWIKNPASASPLKKTAEGYGPLMPDPQGILNLPKGFSYKIISRKGDKMADGLVLPGAPDGMAAFAGRNGRVIVVRNHENGPEGFQNGAFGSSNELLDKVNSSKF